MNEEQDLFVVLSQSLAEFRAAVDGEPGTKVASMGADDGVLPDIIRGTVKGLAEVLSWLQRIAEDIEDYVISGDAAVALFEVGGAAVLALGEGIELGPLGSAQGVPSQAITAVNNTLQFAASAIDKVQTLAASVLPSAEDIFDIQDELTLLLGRRNAPPTDAPGALVRLTNQIGSQ